MTSTAYGIRTNTETWVMFLLVVTIWAISVHCCKKGKRLSWTSVAMCLFGYVWLAFGLEIVARFLLLSYDSVGFGNESLRLAIIPVELINRCLLLVLLFWVCFLVTYVVISEKKFYTPAKELSFIAGQMRALAVPSLFLTSVCLFLCYRVAVPTVLVTPLGLLGSLWVIPAAVIWWDHFAGSRPCSLGLRSATLIPGLVWVWVNPYREEILIVALVPFAAALFAGRRFRLTRVVVFSAALLISSTIVIHLYRQMAWQNMNSSEVELDAHEWSTDWWHSPLSEPLRRFHALDSMLLTVDLIPRTLPYSGERLFSEALIDGIVPRAILADKPKDDRGIKFGQDIWSDNGAGEGNASIAPSITGDLYAAGGWLFVALGGAIWGLLAGLLDSSLRDLAPSAQAALIAFFAANCGLSIEIGFAHTISTILQQVVVLTAVIIIMSAARSRSFSRQIVSRPRVRTSFHAWPDRRTGQA